MTLTGVFLISDIGCDGSDLEGGASGLLDCCESPGGVVSLAGVLSCVGVGPRALLSSLLNAGRGVGGWFSDC